jgi:hypothetical protein
MRRGLLDRQGDSSRKDIALGTVFVFTGLFCFALSFTLFQANGRPVLFFASLAICLGSLAFANSKKGLLLGLLLFAAVRLIWSVVITYGR